MSPLALSVTVCPLSFSGQGWADWKAGCHSMSLFEKDLSCCLSTHESNQVVASQWEEHVWMPYDSFGLRQRCWEFPASQHPGKRVLQTHCPWRRGLERFLKSSRGCETPGVWTVSGSGQYQHYQRATLRRKVKRCQVICPANKRFTFLQPESPSSPSCHNMHILLLDALSLIFLALLPPSAASWQQEWLSAAVFSANPDLSTASITTA